MRFEVCILISTWNCSCDRRTSKNPSDQNSVRLILCVQTNPVPSKCAFGKLGTANQYSTSYYPGYRIDRNEANSGEFAIPQPGLWYALRSWWIIAESRRNLVPISVKGSLPREQCNKSRQRRHEGYTGLWRKSQKPAALEEHEEVPQSMMQLSGKRFPLRTLKKAKARLRPSQYSVAS